MNFFLEISLVKLEPQVANLRQSGNPDTKLDADQWSPNSSNSEIELNINALANASKEYVAATIYHEVFHRFLSDYAQPDLLRKQHRDAIANQYVGVLADGIQKLFPNLSRPDAIALSWGGIRGNNCME